MFLFAVSWFFDQEACGISAPQPGMETIPLHWKAKSQPWTTREVPKRDLKRPLESHKTLPQNGIQIARCCLIWTLPASSSSAGFVHFHWSLGFSLTIFPSFNTFKKPKSLLLYFCIFFHILGEFLSYSLAVSSSYPSHLSIKYHLPQGGLSLIQTVKNESPILFSHSPSYCFLHDTLKLFLFFIYPFALFFCSPVENYLHEGMNHALPLSSCPSSCLNQLYPKLNENLNVSLQAVFQVVLLFKVGVQPT